MAYVYRNEGNSSDIIGCTGLTRLPRVIAYVNWVKPLSKPMMDYCLLDR